MLFLAVMPIINNIKNNFNIFFFIFTTDTATVYIKRFKISSAFKARDILFYPSLPVDFLEVILYTYRVSKRNCMTVSPIFSGSILMMLLWIFLNPLFHVSIYAHTRHSMETINFDHISLEDGLSQNNVFGVLQDYKGFMWFGTEDGLNMYDGYKFKVFKPDLDNPYSISDGYILAIFEDRSFTLWIGTGSGGLNRFDRETGRFKYYQHQADNPNSLSYDCVTSIRECSKQPGKLWIGTRGGGLNKFDIKNRDLHSLLSQPG